MARPLGKERREALGWLADGGALYVCVAPVPLMGARPISEIGSGWIVEDGRRRVSAATVDWLSREGWTEWSDEQKCGVLRSERRDLARALAAGRDVLLVG